MEQWEKSYYITAFAGLTSGSSLVVMSKGMMVTISCYYSCLWLEPPFSDHFPINCKKYPNISLGLCLLTFIFIAVALLINHQGQILYSFGWYIFTIAGTPCTQQSYKVSESFPYKWINKQCKEGFHVTSMRLY